MSPARKPARICFDRVVPASYHPVGNTAARVATAKYAAAVRQKAAQLPGAPTRTAALFKHMNAIQNVGTLSAADPVAVARMALLDVKKWDNGHTLTCRFLDGDDVQKEKVIEKANMWCDYANIQIEFVDDPGAEVRISFHADDGSWSAVGTDCLITSYFPQYQPTMNFGWLRDETDDEEYERVVVHEFGHALGCIHEHQSPNENLKWNVEAVYAAFSGPPNYWTPEDIDWNILKKYSPEGVSATRFDRDSIMLYRFDASLFTDGVGTPLNTHLSEQDKQMISQMYPTSEEETRKLAAD